MSLAAVILAGGRSTRMGVPKALLDYRGAPFVVRILEALVVLEVRPRLVVCGPDAAALRALLQRHDCRLVENPDVDGGPIASLRSALAALRPAAPAAALVWPVDLPHVRVTTVERLIDAYRRAGPPVVAPRFGDRYGHPVIWGAGLFGELESSPAASRDGARAVLRAHAPEVMAVRVDDPAVVDAVNTPADYHRLVRDWSRDTY